MVTCTRKGKPKSVVAAKGLLTIQGGNRNNKGNPIMGRTYKDQAHWAGRHGKDGRKWAALPRVRIEKGGELVETPAPRKPAKHKQRSREAWRDEY